MSMLDDHTYLLASWIVVVHPLPSLALLQISPTLLLISAQYTVTDERGSNSMSPSRRDQDAPDSLKFDREMNCD